MQNKIYAGECNSFYHDAETSSISVQLHGYINDQKLREIANQLLWLIQKYQVHKILIDASLMKIVINFNYQWFLNVWFPEAIDKGLHICALVKSHYFSNLIVILDEIEEVDPEIFLLQTFNKTSEAEKWLRVHKF